MKQRIVKQTEHALLEHSKRVLFELLSLHNQEIQELEQQLKAVKNDLVKEKVKNTKLQQNIDETKYSMSFKVGWVLLHPFSAARRIFNAKIRRKSK